MTHEEVEEEEEEKEEADADGRVLCTCVHPAH